MKSFTLFIILFAFALSGAQAQPSISFERTTHQFGNIQEANGVVSTTFTFTNISDTIVTIKGTWTSCGCTTPKVTRKPLQPGERGTLEVQYDPNGRPGKFNKNIRLLGASIQGKAEVYIQGKVLPHPYPVITGSLRWKTTLFNFNALWHHQTDTLWLPVVNTSNAPVTLLPQKATLPKGMHLLSKSAPLASQVPDSVGLVWNAPASETWGFVYHAFALPVQLAKGTQDSIRLQATAQIKEDFSQAILSGKRAEASFAQDSLQLGNVLAGAKAQGVFKLTNTGNEVLLIRQIKTSCKCLKVLPEARTLVPGSSTQLQVSYQALKHQADAQNMVIMLTLNDPNKPRVRLQVKAHVAKKSK